jgi:hypothetical protein
MCEPVKKNNGFCYLRRQVLKLQQTNERLENNIAHLTDAINRLTTDIHKFTDVHKLSSDKTHYKYICDRIVKKIQNSLVFPRQKNKYMIFDKASGIQFEIIKELFDKNIICSNVYFPNMNPNAEYTYKVKFYVYGKCAKEENFKLLPTYDENDVLLNYNEDVDIFLYNWLESVHFPRFFYETIDANGDIDVAEY